MPGEREAQILERSKCRACGQLPENKVLQCTKGHILCDGCFSVTRPCGVCKEPIPCEIRNTVAEDELDSLELDCEHKCNGCEARVNRKEKRVHVATCDFRQFVPLCSQMGLDCPFQIPRNNIQPVIRHFREHHQFQVVPVGTPISLLLQDFQEVVAAAAASNPSMKTLWPPLLVKTTMGENLAPLFNVFLVSTVPSANSLSTVAIDLTDFCPTVAPPLVGVTIKGASSSSSSGRVINMYGRTKDTHRAQFSFKCASGGSGRRSVPSLSLTMDPFPSMNCKELVSSSPIRNPIPLLASRYMGSDGGLKIQCGITSWTSALDVASESESSIISIPVERVPGGGGYHHRVGGGGDDLIQQLLSAGNNTDSPSGSGVRATGRGRASHRGNNGTRGGRGNGPRKSGSDSGSLN